MSLCQPTAILLGFIMSKNPSGLWFYILIKVQNATSLVFFDIKNPAGWSIYRVKNPSLQIRILVQSLICKKTSPVPFLFNTRKKYCHLDQPLEKLHGWYIRSYNHRKSLSPFWRCFMYQKKIDKFIGIKDFLFERWLFEKKDVF